MSTQFFNDQWRIPSNENQNKVSNYSMSFNGTSDFINLGDSDNFSFGNGVTDLPFSISAWINMTDATQFRLLTKADSTPREYVFYTAGNDKLYFILYDNGGNTNYIGRLYDTALTSFENQWVHLTATYDGSSSSTGIKIYLNGTRVDDTDVNVGSYTAMINTSQDVYIGNFKNSDYANGKIDQVTVFDYALPATGTNSVSTLYGGGTAVTNPMSLSPKPIAYYQLGDQSVSTGANYLVPNNSLDGYVFKLVNPNDGINVPASTDFNFGTGDFTISMWFKINSFPSFPYLFDFRTPPSFTTPVLVCYISTVTNRIQVSNGVSGIISATTGTVLQTGVWYNFIIKRSSGTLTTHFNGGSADQTATDTSNFNTTPKLNIGIRHDNVNGFDGEMSNFQIFNSALPQTGANSIETIYNGGSPLASMSGFTSLVAWWKLNEDDSFNSATSTWTFNDYAGSNDGTSVSMDSSNLVLSNLTKGTSGYSPYALDFDGVNDYLYTNRTVASYINFSVSAWINPASHNITILGTRPLASAATSNGFTMNINSSGNLFGRIFTETSNVTQVGTGSTISLNNWSHVAMTYDSSSKTLKTYLDGAEVGSVVGTDPSVSSTSDFDIGRGSVGTIYDYFNGEISNVAIFNTTLSSTEITEVYNQGVPSNLNTFSGTAPTSWWQLGSNSSYSSGAWTCLDETGTNNATSYGNMTNSDIVDGVGYSASGLGTSSIDIVGDAPYSTSNGISQGGMDVLDRSTDVPS